MSGFVRMACTADWMPPPRSLGARVGAEVRIGKDDCISDVVRVQFYPILWQGMNDYRTEAILYLKTALRGLTLAEASVFMDNFAALRPTGEVERGPILHATNPYGLYRVL